MDEDQTRAGETLIRAAQGDAAAAEALLPLVYDELRALAARFLRGQRGDHTLQPTALVHEAYLRMIGQEDSTPKTYRHFVGAAACAMRSILVDHARARNAAKRGGDRQRLPFDIVLEQFEQRAIDLLELNDALAALARLDARQSQIVELRFFGGLNNQEIAAALDLPLRTIERAWRLARAWLRNRLQGDATE